jgi:diketogulonate reductase-like aldo/keto reductase
MIKDAVNEAYILTDHKVKRKDLFFSCKLWNIHHRKEMAILGLNDSLANLGLDCLDLYAIGSPMGFKVDYYFIFNHIQ